MIVVGSGEISSTEGTTQGDPVAMAMYALAIVPLIHKLRHSSPDVKQAWYADDATGAGSCEKLITLPTHNQMLVSTSVQEVFGTQAKTHLLMLGFSTPTRQATAPWPLLLHTTNMS